MEKVLIKGGYLVDPGSNKEGYYDILINDDIIEKVEKNIEAGENVSIVQGNGKFIVPGFIDLQVNPGNTIEYISNILPYCGVTTPLIHPCEVRGEPFLSYYNDIENVLNICDGLRVNVANCISIQPIDTEGYKTYEQLTVSIDEIEQRVHELIDLGVIAIGEVVLPLGGVAHISSDMSESFLDKLLDATEKNDIPILLHTGLGLNGIKEAVKASKGRKLHICHIGSTCSMGNIHEALLCVSQNDNITTDTHLSEIAGSTSGKSKIMIEYLKQGEVMSIDKDTLETTVLTDLDDAKPPYYYNKINLFENNIICALSEDVNAIESDDLGDGIRVRRLIKNFFRLVNSSDIEHIKIKLMRKLIKKLTINPAEILNIDRGTLKEGAYADIVFLDLENEVVDTVFVNGKAVLKDGKLTNNKPGRRLKYQENRL